MLRAISRLGIIILIGLSACSLLTPNTPPPTGTSGIEGYVTEGPMCPGPVQIGATECADQPYQATISVLSATGDQITKIMTGVDGYFKIPLAPGTYILHPESDNSLPYAADQTIEVMDGQYTLVSIMYDTGMR